jgi:hypothetical protein
LPKAKPEALPLFERLSQADQFGRGCHPLLGSFDCGEGIVGIDEHLLFAELLHEDKSIRLALRFQDLTAVFRWRIGILSSSPKR